MSLLKSAMLIGAFGLASALASTVALASPLAPASALASVLPAPQATLSQKHNCTLTIEGIGPEAAEFLKANGPHPEKFVDEYLQALQAMAGEKKVISFIGSARIESTQSEKLAGMLAQDGYTIVTGGGPGVMKSANKGAFEAGGRSIGLNILLPFEEKPNPYLSPGFSLNFKYFFTRKVVMGLFSSGFVADIGGLGTLDEAFEMLTLIQTHKMKMIPFIFIGNEFAEAVKNLVNVMVKMGTISPRDIDLISFVGSVEEARDILNNHWAKEHPAIP